MLQELETNTELKNALLNSSNVVILTGAGISAESGVPTFRDKEGLWKKYRPEELANADAFMQNPQLVWEWYQWRRRLIHDVKPNPGHYALAEMEKLYPNFTLVTQNVDGLHREAGSSNVVELHGNIRRNKCFDCGKFVEVPDLDLQETPKCESCGGLIRPDVVWFGEMLPADAINLAFNVSRACDLFISVGTSALVHPAASLPVMAMQGGAYVLEVNPNATAITPSVDHTFYAPSGEILPDIVKFVKENRNQ
ncbi:NAD-dependent deacylase [bacterium]|nr:NAD-dependent deacylase [bacterium]